MNDDKTIYDVSDSTLDFIAPVNEQEATIEKQALQETINNLRTEAKKEHIQFYL
jgi:hypothetical protein